MNECKAGQQVCFFKRWTRKSYAIFNSLHKLITICFIALGCSFILKPVSGFSQNKPDTSRTLLEAVDVTADEITGTTSLETALLQTTLTGSEIERTPVQTLNELLEHLHGLDIRQRGPLGTQADISYRGGNFDQTIVLLNGINIADPQTGHYTLNIPVNPDIISKIELYKNSTAFLCGSAPFSGLINIITRPDSNDNIGFSLTGGMYRLLKTAVNVNLHTRKFTHLLSLDYNTSGGYKPNTDFDIVNAFYYGTGRFKSGELQIQAGYSDKKYGANGFYSLKYPNQYESTATFLTSVRWVHTGKIDWIPAVYYRRNRDCFELVKGQSPFKNNYHLNQVLGGNMVTAFRSLIGKTSIGLDFRLEDILSTSLGHLLEEPIPTNISGVDYTRKRNRNITGLSFSQHYENKGWNVDFTLLMQNFSDYRKKVYFLPAGYLSYNIKPSYGDKLILREKIFITAASSLRMPTFTDLYYKTGDILGNENLLPERAYTFELGSRFNLIRKGRSASFLISDVALFHRRGKDMIDYIKLDEESLWHTVNHTSVNFLGFEVSVKFLPSNLLIDKFFITLFGIEYSYLYSDKNSSGFQSRYLLDHLRHKLSFLLSHRIFKGLNVDYSLSYQDRKGEYISYKLNSSGEYQSYPSYWLLDIRIDYTYRILNFYVEASNLLNSKYYDLGDLEQPGIWIKTGLKCKINM